MTNGRLCNQRNRLPFEEVAKLNAEKMNCYGQLALVCTFVPIFQR